MNTTLTGEMIRAARAFCRLEQAELAAAAGISLETIKRLERIRGRVNASGATLQALVAAFQLYDVTFAIDPKGRSCVEREGTILVMRSRSRLPSRQGYIGRYITAGP